MATETAAAERRPTLAESIDDYRLSLHAAGKSKSTQAVYTLALRTSMPTSPARGCRSTCRASAASTSRPGSRRSVTGRAPATVSVYYRSLQPFWRWAIEEGFVRESPMANMHPPIVPEQPVPILPVEHPGAAPNV